MDAAYLLDWANLLLRWAHVITAIAWIGSSFYFVFLDNSLTRPVAPDLVGKGVALHTPELIKQHAQAVYQQAAALKLMPLNNATQMTEDERALIKRWFDAGAPVN